MSDLTRPEKIEAIEAAADMRLMHHVALSALAMRTAEFIWLREREARLALDIDREGVAL